MTRVAARPLLTVIALLAGFAVALVVRPPHAEATGSLSHGSLTMVSTRADGTSGPALSNTFGADQEAISDDGKVIAFVSPIPADQLVTDPVQTGHVTDTNDATDVFVWDSRVPAPLGPIVSLVSWNKGHNGTGNAPSDQPIMAPGGLGIVFNSGATDLVTAPTGAFSKHLYAWVPLVSEAFPVFMVDENYAGTAEANSVSSDPSIAVTPLPVPAVKVAFTSSATDLVNPMAHQALGPDQVYVRSFLPTPTTEMVSVDDTGGDGTVSGARASMIAADGVHLVFESGGADLVNGVAETGGDIFVRNLLTDSTTLISQINGGTQGTSGNGAPAISADGSAVVWDGNDPDLSPTTHNGNNHIFYRTGAGAVQMVDTDFTGSTGCNSASNNPGLSLDGTAVVFESFCSDIVASGVADDSGTDVFTRRMSPLPDVPDHAPRLVSINDAGTASGNGDSFICPGNGAQCGASTNPGVTINADGTAITFFSNSSDIGTPPGGASSNNGNVFVRYPDINKTVNLTVNATGHNPDGISRDPVISADGGSVAFVSLADDLVTPDTNDGTDIFKSDIHNSFFIQPISPVEENAGTVTITVGRTGSNGTTDSVKIETGDGFDASIVPIDFPDATEAFQPGDYTDTTKTLTFLPGVATQTFTVPIHNDAVQEGIEVFHVSLSSSTGAGSVALPGPLSDAYVPIFDDDGPPQDWHVAVTQQPPAAAQVGDTVTVQATISVDPGVDDVSVTSLSSGAGTSGLDQGVFADATPFTVNAGMSKVVTATARVAGAPGTAGIHLQVSVDGSLGAMTATKTADTTAITSTEAVTAALAAVPATVGLADQITYTLTLTDAADTPAQLTGLPAGFTAPAGTTQSSRTDGLTTIPANGTSTWTLLVDVDDADTNATTITEAPGAISYAMSAISLPNRPAALTPSSVTSTVHAPVVAVGTHSLTDVNGGTLDPGDAVHVSVTVANTGGANATATLSDALTDVQSPTVIKLDGLACGACSSTSSSVTAPLGALAAGGSHVVTFTATIPASPGGSTASSSATVAFSPATTGTSPTTADVASLTIGDNNVQDWDVAVTQQPPASATVGDTVTVKATIAVEPGADDLHVTALSSGAGTSGLDQVTFTDAAPFTVAAGSDKVLTATARVIGAPGAGGIHLQVSVAGTLGAAASTETAGSSAITSAEALSAALTGSPATVGPAGQLSYTLTLTNASDTPAQLTGLPAGFVAPTGTTQASRTDGTTTVTANGTSTWTLVVDVDDADADGSTITETPGAVSYAMSAISLASRPVAVTPTSVTSTVIVPAITSADHTTFTIGTDGTFTVSTKGIPGATLTETGALPSAVTFLDNGDGTATLSGTSDAGTDAAYPLTLTASNGTDHADQSFTLTVVKTAQTITITSTPPAHPVVGNTYPVAAMSDSGLTVSFSIDPATTNAACSLLASTLTFDNAGTCVLDADQAGNGTYQAAPKAQQSLVVSAVGTAVNVVSSKSTTVFGQAAHATATVTADSGSPAGAVQFAVDGTDLGAPITLTGGQAVSPDLTESAGHPLVPGSHAVTAAFTPTDKATYAGSQGSVTQIVDKAATKLKIAVHSTTVTAAVTAVSPGAGAAAGSVSFTVGGKHVGSAALHTGVATLHYTVQPGMTQHVAASYGGDAHFTGSSASTSRHDPSITATVTSKHAKTHFGWYRSQVKVSLHCAKHGAALTHPCPAAVSLTHSGAGQAVTRTITATDGGTDTVALRNINIDLARPSVRVTGVRNGATYDSTPTLHCVAHDALSGVASCKITLHKSAAKTAYRATATDRAGNTRTVIGSYHSQAISIDGAPFVKGAFNVKLGRTYTLVVHSTGRPTYYDAAPAPTVPFVRDQVFHAAGHHRWALGVTMTQSLHHYRYWNLGVKIGNTMHVIGIRVS